MRQIPIEELLPMSDWSMYALVRMAAIRSLELADGKPRLLEDIPSDKLTTIALNEIVQGRVELKEVSEKRKKETP